MKRALLAAVAACSALAATACPLKAADGSRLSDGPVSLAWRSESGPIAQGRPFALRVVLCPAGAELVAVDATMPAHRHGMNYQPSLHAQGGGRWRAEGLLWHMSGAWELRFEVMHAGQAHRLRQTVQLK